MRSLTLSIILTLLTAGSAIAQLPDSCIVTGTLYNADMSVAAHQPVKVIKLVKSGKLISNRSYTDSTDANGYIRLRLWRAAEAWIYSPVIGLDASPMTGTKLIIPDAATAELQLLPTSTTVPATYVVAVPNMRVIAGVQNALVTTLVINGTAVSSTSLTHDTVTVTIDAVEGGGGTTSYGDSIRVADSLARVALTRRTYISRLTAAIVIDSSTPGRYVISLDPDSVAAWLQDRDSSFTWMLGRIVQLQDSGLAARGYITPTGLRSMLAGYSLTSHVHAISDVSGLSTALGDSIAYRARMTAVENDLKLVHDTLTAIRNRADAAFNNLVSHAATADAHLPAQSAGTVNKVLQSNGTASSWQPLPGETDPTVALRIRDSLALYNLPWMRGDTATIGRILDGMYPRSGGGGVIPDTLTVNGPASTASRPFKINIAGARKMFYGQPYITAFATTLPGLYQILPNANYHAIGLLDSANGTGVFLWGTRGGGGGLYSSGHNYISCASGNTIYFGGNIEAASGTYNWTNPNGNIIATTGGVKSKYVRTDSLNISGEIIRDTSNVWRGDTANVRWLGPSVEPLYDKEYGGYPDGYKYGERTFILEHRKNSYGNGIFEFDIVMDSSNGVKWDFIEIETVWHGANNSTGISGKSWDLIGYDGVPIQATQLKLVTSTGTGTYKAWQAYTGTRVTINQIQAVYTFFTRAKITVHYRLPVANTSTWYIKPINF
jgi:hypothetical protein